MLAELAVDHFLGGIWKLLDASALIGSLAGAFAGALAAVTMEERKQKRALLLAEIRTTNVAIVLALTICNAFLSSRKQHVGLIKSAFTAQKKNFDEFRRARERGEISTTTQLELRADLQQIPPLEAPIHVLQDHVLNRLTFLNGRPVALAVQLDQSTNLLNAAHRNRNASCEEFRSGRRPVNPHTYLGVPKEGHTDVSYPNFIEQIDAYTDDCIWFSNRLCKDLEEHGNEIRAKFVERFGRDCPHINKPDFSRQEAEGLIPPDQKFSDWLSGFGKRAPVKKLWFCWLRR